MGDLATPYVTYDDSDDDDEGEGAEAGAGAPAAEPPDAGDPFVDQLASQ